MKTLLCALAMLFGTSSAWAMTLPTLPTPFAQQTRPTITGSTFTVTTCANFKTALDSAAAASLSLNHVINVQAGLNCTLMYLPPHLGASGGWIIVRSANFASLPPAGTRVALADAANMPVLTYGTKTNPYTGCGDEAALAASTNAQNYWIEGFDFEANTACPGCVTPNKNYSLILTGYANCQYTNTKNLVFSHIIMRDQDANHILARGILCEMDKGGLALLDSYAVGIKSPPSDEAQAVACSNNPGPTLIQNNFLQASTEVIIFGGAGALDAAHVPQDITVRLNDLSHDLAMRNPTNPWSLKTLLELKMGVRVLIEANTFKYAWTGVNGDDGHAFRFTVRSWGACATCFYFTGNQFGNPANPLCNTLPICPQSVAAVTDVTFRYNDTRHMGSAWSMFSSDDGNGGNSQPIARWYFHNNLFADFTYDATCLGGCGSMFDWANGGPYPALDILFEHNTFYNDGTVDSRIMNAGSAPIGQVSGGPVGSNPPVKTADMDFIFRNNIIQFGTYGIVGNTVNGPGALDSSFTTGALPNGYLWTNNVISGFAASGASMSTYVQGTRFVNNCYSTNGAKDGAGNAAMTVAQIGFDNPGNGDSNTFVLTNSAFKAGGACQATDGTDQGVNWTAFNAARVAAPVASTYYVDPDYNGTVRDGQATTPWKSLADTVTNTPWTVLNSALASADVTVYFSARNAGSNTNQASTDRILINRTDTSTHRLTMDGISQYNVNDSTPSWAVNVIPSASNYRTASKFQITAQGPIQSSPSATKTNCENYFTFQGFRLIYTGGGAQIANLTFLGNLIFQYNEGSTVQGFTVGPGVIIGPVTGPTCPISHIVVQDNYIHDTFGEGIYVGSPSDTGNPTDPPANRLAGDDVLIQRNVITNPARWGGQGEGIDVKDGWTNLRLLNNIITYPDLASYAVDPFCDCQGIAFESGTVIDGNYIEAPKHKGITVGAAYENTTGRTSLSVRNNILVNITTDSGIVVAPPDGGSSYQWSNVAINNNSIYLTGDFCIRIDTGSVNVSARNNLCHSSTWGGIQAGSGVIGVHDYNLFYNIGNATALIINGVVTGCSAVATVETHSLCTNPLYVNTTPPYADINFRLQSSSPARNAGLDLSATFTTDYAGAVRTVPWSMGAFTVTGGAAAPAPPTGLVVQ